MQKKTVLITGATSMIGRAASAIFAKEGCRLALVGRNSEKLRLLEKSLSSPSITYKIDATSETAVNDVVNDVCRQFGSVDVLISNTSIYPYDKIEKVAVDEWNDVIATTLTAPFLFAKYCIPIMKKQKQGKIIFMSSLAGETLGLPMMASYSAAKAGVNGFMRTAAVEMGRFNINVNSISTGKMYDESSMTQNEFEEMVSSIPLKRFIQPEDAAHLALFLASDKANNITGQNFIIDGGQSILGEPKHLSL